jgi:uncharacterized membrane protein
VENPLRAFRNGCPKAIGFALLAFIGHMHGFIFINGPVAQAAFMVFIYFILYG